ncbi:MAG: hypothetical protein GXP39_00580 [Chloroflexi bacterium]|nr:hypothetical protein [Chloroflexota bacterium]
MAIAQSQEAVAQSTQVMGAPTRGLAAAWSGDAAVQMFMEMAVIAAVPAVASVGASRASFPLLPAAVPGLAGLPKNSIITATPFTVRGLPFGNRPLADYISLWGATVSPASNDEKVYIIDFHGLRNVRNVSVTGGGALKIRPWEGLRFAEEHITLGAGQTLNLLTQKIEVTLSNALSQADFEAKTRIDCQSYPSNVRFVIAQSVPEKDQDDNFIVPKTREGGKLLPLSSIPFAQATGKEPILWTYNGDLAGEVTLPDFSRELNEFLESSPAQEGLCFPHLVAYSDTPGFLEIVETGGSPSISLNYVNTIEFTGEDPLSTSVAFRRHGDEQTVTLTLFRRGQQGKFVTPAGVDDAAPHVRVQKVQFELSGTMDDDRLDPDARWAQQATLARARVSGIFSLAQPVTPQADRRVAGIDLYLSVDASADLILELQGDASGAPDGHALATASIDGSDVTQEPGWVSARFDEPVDVEGKQTLWIVLKARAGEADWLADVASGPAQPLRYSRDGAFWTTHEPPMTGLHKLKIVPPPAERPAALSANLLTRQGIALSPGENPQTVVVLFDQPGAELNGSEIELTLTPEAAGEITLASVVVEYVPVAASS